ncbi:ORF6N domain-containing protein [Adlercreutzia caecimuris]|uniref:ORF6N domain-containing protein n=1 Tax=Adlercreutzia caecimuris TaxID=671266 RepID=UPI00249554EF|nr:ORF6N domain-containing protein [Adlercreutzia caecimuris]
MPEVSIEAQVEENPGRFIHILRDKQVVIDSDLAFLYEVETKYLNRVASRHADRFPDDFRFQLDKDEYENLRCQIVTSSDNQSGHGGRRYMPYAYTEQGVAMLSGLLNSPKAVQVSVGIMRAFVEMRKFIANNAALLDRMATIEYRQLEYQQSTDERFDKVFGYLEAHALPSQKIFFKGEMFDAFTLLVDLVKTAEKSLTVIDGYVDEKTLNILSKKNDGVECRLVTYPSASLTSSDVTVFESQHGPLSICRTSDFHDRFLVVDDDALYHIGASLKDAGKKTFAMTLIGDEELKSALLDKLDEVSWTN